MFAPDKWLEKNRHLPIRPHSLDRNAPGWQIADSIFQTDTQ
jgi:hypothetical protein